METTRNVFGTVKKVTHHQEFNHITVSMTTSCCGTVEGRGQSEDHMIISHVLPVSAWVLRVLCAVPSGPTFGFSQLVDTFSPA